MSTLRVEKASAVPGRTQVRSDRVRFLLAVCGNGAANESEAVKWKSQGNLMLEMQ